MRTLSVFLVFPGVSNSVFGTFTNPTDNAHLDEPTGDDILTGDIFEAIGDFTDPSGDMLSSELSSSPSVVQEAMSSVPVAAVGEDWVTVVQRDRELTREEKLDCVTVLKETLVQLVPENYVGRMTYDLYYLLQGQVLARKKARGGQYYAYDNTTNIRLFVEIPSMGSIREYVQALLKFTVAPIHVHEYISSLNSDRLRYVSKKLASEVKQISKGYLRSDDEALAFTTQWLDYCVKPTRRKKGSSHCMRKSRIAANGVKVQVWTLSLNSLRDYLTNTLELLTPGEVKPGPGKKRRK